MKKTYIYITTILIAFLGCVTSAYAQEATLSKEITVETDFVPVEQKATKLNTLPEVMKTSVEKKTLSYSDLNQMVNFPYSINKFEPYGYKTKYQFAKNKGYVDLGIGTQLNAVGSAGYRIIDNDRDRLRAWLQHTSTWLGQNSSPLATGNPAKQQFNDNVVGADYSHRFNVGTLGINALYHFDRFNYYGANDSLSYASPGMQMVNEFKISSSWKNAAKPGKSQLYAQVGFNHFGYYDNPIDDDYGLKENNIHLNAGLEGVFGGFAAGVNADWDYLWYCDAIGYEHNFKMLLKATPFIRWRGNKLNIIGGVNIDFSINDGNNLCFSPVLKLDYSIIDGIVAYADVKGGKKLNTLSSLYSTCRYIAPNVISGSSFCQIDAEVGFKIGTFEGFYAKPYFAYGIFNDALLPYITRKEINTEDLNTTQIDIVAPYVFTQRYDIKGWKAGINLGYNYNNIVDFKAGFQYSPQDRKNGYMTGLDRAEMIADAQLMVTPIKNLCVTLGYELRIGRKYYSYYGEVGTPPIEAWYDTPEEISTLNTLKNINNLSLTATYQINKTFGVFLNSSNLLNQQWDEFVGMGAQKINALAGVNIMF